MIANGKHIFFSEIPVGNFGLPFKTFRKFWKFSGREHQNSLTIYIHSNRNFGNFLVSGKQPLSYWVIPFSFHQWQSCHIITSKSWSLSMLLSSITLTDGQFLTRSVLKPLLRWYIHECATAFTVTSLSNGSRSREQLSVTNIISLPISLSKKSIFTTKTSNTLGFYLNCICER